MQQFENQSKKIVAFGLVMFARLNAYLLMLRRQLQGPAKHAMTFRWKENKHI